MDETRVIRLRTPHPDDDQMFRFGSGYVVGPGLVLTAAHVLTPPIPGAEPNRGGTCHVLPWGGDGEAGWVTARVLDFDAKRDIAVVSAPEVAAEALAASVRWARLEGCAPVRWDAVGFPVAGLAAQGRRAEHAWGTVSPVTEAHTSTLGLVIESRDSPATAPGRSGWAGLSGAAVFSQDRLVGVVTEDPPTFAGSLTAVRSDVVEGLPGLFEALGRPRFDVVGGGLDPDGRRRLAIDGLLAALRDQAEQLSYASIHRAVGQGRVPPLSQVYIEQQPEQIAEDSERGRDGGRGPKRAREGETGRRAGAEPELEATTEEDLAELRQSGSRKRVALPETPAQALGRQRHLVVEGGPGVGKSTLLSHLTLSALALQDGDLGDTVVPVRVAARHLASGDAALATRLRAAVLAYVGPSLLRDLPDDLFEDRPDPRRTWLVLVDGLDEVVDRSAREELVDSLCRHAAQGLRPLRFVVTSRPVDELDRFERPLFGRYRLRPFDVGQVKAFADSWFSARSMSTPTAADGDTAIDTAAGRNIDAETFLAQVEESRLGDLARVPLMLSMAAVVFERASTRALPSSRAQLYQEFVAALLEDRRKVLDDREVLRAAWAVRYDQDGRAWADRVFDRRRDLLESLALEESDQPEGLLLWEAVDWVLAEGLVPEWVEEGWLVEQLEALLLRTGLLVKQEGQLSFLHETYRDYLAASAMAHSTPPDSDDGRRLLARWPTELSSERLTFVVGIWGEETGGRAEDQSSGVDLTEVLRRIWRRLSFFENYVSLLMVGRLLADGVQVSRDYRDNVIAHLVDLADDTSKELFPVEDQKKEAVGLLARLGCRDDLFYLLDRWGGTVGAAAAEGLGMLGEVEEATDAMLDEIESGGEITPPVRALAALGQTDRAVAVLQAIVEDRDLDPARRAEAAVRLHELGRPEARNLLLEISRTGQALRPGIAEDVVTALWQLGHADEAARDLLKVAWDPSAEKEDRAEAIKALALLGRVDDLAELMWAAPGPVAVRRGLRQLALWWVKLMPEGIPSRHQRRDRATLKTLRRPGWWRFGEPSVGDVGLLLGRVTFALLLNLVQLLPLTALLRFEEPFDPGSTTIWLVAFMSAVVWTGVVVLISYGDDQNALPRGLRAIVRQPALFRSPTLSGKFVAWPTGLWVSWSIGVFTFPFIVGAGVSAAIAWSVAIPVPTVAYALGALRQAAKV